MASSTAARRVSVEEYLGEPRYEHCEYIDGHVVELNLGGGPHSRVQAYCAATVVAYLRAKRNGEVFTEMRCRLRAGGGTRFYQPDLAVIAGAAGYAFRFHDGAPDLVVEIRSPGDGAKLAWVVLPEEKTVLVCRPDAPAHPASSGEALDGGTLFPGLTVPVDDLFD